jgi:hypothetical protein
MYLKAFGISDKEFKAEGEEGAFTFSVCKEHADFIAEGLYHYLLKKKTDYFEGFVSKMI